MFTPLRTCIAAFAVAVLCGLLPAAAAAEPVTFDGISEDGSVAVFSTKDQMVPGDTDQQTDVYLRSYDQGLTEYVTREVSIGPSGGNDALPAQYDGISANGEEVFFSTRERLVPADKDHKEDVYVRYVGENRTVLVSVGAGESQGTESCAAQNCGNGELDASFVPEGIPAAGGEVFFATTEKLTAADTDEALDIYVRDLGAETTKLVSAPATGCSRPNCGNEANQAQFQTIDEAGDVAIFTTKESLAPEDTDSSTDIYARNLTTGTTSLVSVPGVCPEGAVNCNPSFPRHGISADGSHVFFETQEQVAAGDEDTSQDLYDWTGSGTPALVSTGPASGNLANNATFAASSPDGAAVYFETAEALTSEDADLSQDVYMRSGGVTTLVSAGMEGRGNEGIPASFEWTSPNASSEAVLFSTAEQMTAEDEDHSQDVYERAGGVTRLVSTAPGAPMAEVNAAFDLASVDGSRIYFTTAQPLSPEDQDSSNDIYVTSAAGTELVSIGPVGGNGGLESGLHAISSDGSRAFFVTAERLTVDDDFAGEDDLYERSPRGTVLVSVKNAAELVLGPPPPTLERTVPASPNASTLPTIVGQSLEGAAIKIYATYNCSGEPVAQGSAEELASPGLTVTVPAPPNQTTSYRATAEAEGIVSACSSPIGYRQEEPAPPPPPSSGGEEGGTGSGGTGSGGTGSGGTGSKTGGGGSGTGTGTGGGAGLRHDGILYVAPLPHITFAPGGRTRKRRPAFRFVDATGQPGTTFFCRIDGARWSPCSSPMRIKRKLSFGHHTLRLRAVNAVGVRSGTIVKRRFEVVRG